MSKINIETPKKESERVLWSGKPSARFFAVLVFIPVFGWLMIPWYLIYWRFRQFTITTVRVKAKKGIGGRIYEMKFSELADVSVQRGIIARIIGIGTIVFNSRGGGKVVFDGIADPESVKNMIVEEE